MSLKKCNAVRALATALALLVHVGYNAFAYLTLYYNHTLKVLTAFPFLFCACLHALEAGFKDVDCRVWQDKEKIYES